jgi:glycosyltransferase domain-containing protein
MNSDLTILLLLKGRDAFTIRWFDYAKENAIPYKVIVADGGHDEGLENELYDRQFSQYIDYEYIRYPFDENHKTFYAKVLDALMRVETTFVVLGSNDDFIFSDSLESSLHFLKENPDFVTSRGEIWDFSVSSHSLDSRISNENDHVFGNLNGVTRLYDHPNAEGDSATDRVMDYSLKSNSVWHDVVRTDKLRDAYSALIKSEINDFRLADSLISFFVASNGKIHRGSELYMLHQCHPDMGAITIIGDTTLEWIDSTGWNTDLNRFLDVIAREISEIDKITFLEAKCKLMECYFVNIVLKTMMNGYSPQGTSNGTNESTIKLKIASLIKSILKRNSFFFNTYKKIVSLFSVSRENELPSFPFDEKLENISMFLKSRTPNFTEKN